MFKLCNFRLKNDMEHENGHYNTQLCFMETMV